MAYINTIYDDDKLTLEQSMEKELDDIIEANKLKREKAELAKINQSNQLNQLEANTISELPKQNNHETVESIPLYQTPIMTERSFTNMAISDNIQELIGITYRVPLIKQGNVCVPMSETVYRDRHSEIPDMHIYFCETNLTYRFRHVNHTQVRYFSNLIKYKGCECDLKCIDDKNKEYAVPIEVLGNPLTKYIDMQLVFYPTAKLYRLFIR